MLDSRTRLEHRLRDVEEKVGAAAAHRTQPSATSPASLTPHHLPLQLEEMDAKFEHNIASMNELLQKNLKYLKHVAQP